ncbi:MAG: succinate--CoA ligase subunit beta, partial [Chloroflexi bacterium]|nr:succinate--CoA ligase subunit beta [Chloroflexota bacterium]
MKLHEYQSKRIFAKFGVPIPKGEVATTPEEAKKIAQDLGGSVVVKSQVLVGGRGKAGGIKLAKSPDEAEKYAKEILDLEIKGLPVNLVLIDEAAEINNEIYLGITNDRGARMPVFMASAAGGVDIEEVAATTPPAAEA